MKTIKDLKEERKQIDEKHAKFVSDLPVIIVLKRISIRRYPDNQSVGLYYSDRLKRHIAIPFSNAIVDAGEPE